MMVLSRQSHGPDELIEKGREKLCDSSTSRPSCGLASCRRSWCCPSSPPSSPARLTASGPNPIAVSTDSSGDHMNPLHSLVVSARARASVLLVISLLAMVLAGAHGHKG